ncbi:MAG: hypothetical protein ChlgKO_05470 [Chlamydiales bacterium]
MGFIFPLLAQTKILHLTFHTGCAKELEYVAEQLNLDLTTLYIHNLLPKEFDGVASGSALYNIGHDRAERIWKRHFELFDQYDIIVTSDTVALSRIFLQNNWKKPLIVWVCNRFDYSDRATLDCCFPDREYFQLIRSIQHRPNVQIFSYTPFEHRYAKCMRKIDFWSDTIKPTGGNSHFLGSSSLIPKGVKREETFFVPAYHNDKILLDLSKKLTNLGIKNYQGRYAGPGDLIDFKGIVHIPYAWSNLALFENWSNGLVYFIPSKKFLLELAKNSKFFWSPPFIKKYLSDAEWYLPEHSKLFVYFDSWEDLVEKVRITDYAEMQERVHQFAIKHREETLVKWQRALFDFS